MLRLLPVVLAAGLLTLPSSIGAEAVQPGQPKDDGKLRIIIFGAHPDDAEFKAGGTAIKWSKAGHHVKLVSVTNGDIGHWQIRGEELAKRRNAEVQAAAKVLGVTTQVLDIHDGELEPNLENRKRITKLIRDWKADIVIAHRPWDYHPDHRYVGVLVQDAAFMVTVPFFVPESPPLKRNPVFLYSSDRFQKPYPFRPAIAVAIDDVFEQKLNAIHELASQVYEGGASGDEAYVASVPPAKDVEGRKKWLRQQWERRQSNEAVTFRDALVKTYGPEKGEQVKFAETYELCEYGRQPSAAELKKLFPIGE
jgi:LmbE family N-acetylglucosaminyl deacetylase